MQPVIPASFSARHGVGDIFPAVRPADVVAFAPHQRNKFLAVMCIFHALVNGVHEAEFPAIPFGSGVVLCVRHRFGLLFLLRLENGQAELHAHLIVTLAQHCQLGFTDMQFLPIFKADAVDEKMGVDMVTVYVRADQHLTVLKILR